LILTKYGASNEIIGIIKRAYKNASNHRRVIANELTYSFFFKNLKNYKSGIPIAQRLLFEFFIWSFIHYDGKLNFSGKQFKQQLGIAYPDRIIKDFIEKGFLYKHKIQIQYENKKVPKSAFTINPNKIAELAKEYMIDSTTFVQKVTDLLKGVYGDGYLSK